MQKNKSREKAQSIKPPSRTPFRLEAGDWLVRASGMTARAEYAYFRLLIRAHNTRSAALPNDAADLAAACRITLPQWRQAQSELIALSLIVITAGKVHLPEADENLTATAALREKRAAAGRAGGRPRSVKKANAFRAGKPVNRRGLDNLAATGKQAKKANAFQKKQMLLEKKANAFRAASAVNKRGLANVPVKTEAKTQKKANAFSPRALKLEAMNYSESKLKQSLIINSESESRTDSLTIKIKTKKRVKPPVSAEFYLFWRQWQPKRGKAAAQRAWVKAEKKISADEIITAAQTAQAHYDSTDTENRFRPHAATWLNGERWNDEWNEPPQSENKTADGQATRSAIAKIKREQGASK